MIIWLSGPYGVGKSTLAEAMAAIIKNALIFDAEEVGNAVRETTRTVPMVTYLRTTLYGVSSAVCF